MVREGGKWSGERFVGMEEMERDLLGRKESGVGKCWLKREEGEVGKGWLRKGR